MVYVPHGHNHSIIKGIISSNSIVYCAFVGFKSCFVTVDVNKLYVKLVQMGVSCTFLNMFKSFLFMYTAFFRMKHDIRDCNDLNNLAENYLNQFNPIHLLKFADDIALFTTDKNSCQSQLDSLCVHSYSWEFFCTIMTALNKDRNTLLIFKL